jgi:FKBP-type peptidyl-prolyl cis-trans isomerase FklB
MKKYILTVLAVGMSAGHLAAADKADFKTSEEKGSYIIGFNIGSSIKRDGFSVIPEKLLTGLKEALDGKKPAFSPEEIQEIMSGLQQQMAAKQKESAGAAAGEGVAFLKANKVKEGVKTTASGLQYKVLKSGKGKSPKVDDKVTTHYRGTLIDGTEFDSSYGRGQPATFPVNGVIKGWTEALQLMKEGDKWQLFIPTELAYGARGAGAKIAPHSALIFEIELLKIN